MPTYLNEENARRMAPIFAERLSRENRGFMLLLDETHLIPDGEDMCFASIFVTVERWPWPYPTDLGRRIADVIRAACTGPLDPRSDTPVREDGRADASAEPPRGEMMVRDSQEASVT